MSSTVVERTPLGPSELARRWYLDVDTSVSGDTPTWTPVNGITEFKPNYEPGMEDDSDYDSGGHQSQTVSNASWGCEGKVRRATTAADPSVYDPGQEFLRSKQDQFGVANRARVRFYEMGNSRTEAYQGFVAVNWTPDGGNTTALARDSFNLTGQGRRQKITHPAPLTP